MGTHFVQLRAFFRRKRVVDMEFLESVFPNRSRRSLFRDLSSIGYCSSYSHAGQFYALAGDPDFDQNGLWHSKGISFSRFGTLKATVQILIEKSKAGYTHGELKAILRIRVQNTLNDLITESIIIRESFEGFFLYLSSDKRKAKSQESTRQLQLKKEDRGLPLDLGSIIEVLLELLRSNEWDSKKISTRLRKKEVSVSRIQILEVMTHYGLKKNPRDD